MAAPADLNNGLSATHPLTSMERTNMEQVNCPACGLQMNVDAFTNCPNCHTLIEAAPATVETAGETTGDDQGPGITIGQAGEPPAGDMPEPPPEAPGGQEPEQPTAGAGPARPMT